jgi:hypothetical protein
MDERVNRRHVLLVGLALPAVAVASVSGCSGEDPNRLVSGTMVKPLESVEKADEEAAKYREAKLKAARAKRKR